MKKNKTIKLEGVSLNAAFVAGISRADWMKHGKEAGYFALVGNKTPTDAQWTEIMGKAYDEAHKATGTTPAVKGNPDKDK